MAETKTASKPAAKAKKDELVEVSIVRGTYYVQPSTGIVISKTEPVAKVADDSWLQMQIEAKLLEKVKKG